AGRADLGRHAASENLDWWWKWPYSNTSLTPTRALGKPASTWAHEVRSTTLNLRLVFPKTVSDFRGDATAFIKRYRTSIRAEL
ncbi:hypothetical protein, partial [Mesorhizobium sp. M7A.F.Ca.CA.002.09.1.1]|uniref:hypothetical protein n=1 Tax=Mesorhizobium sp. M7A.F.Ca.CA.002.09.1.1 TaxID=2496739 RepID=UPI0019D261DB